MILDVCFSKGKKKRIYRIRMQVCTDGKVGLVIMSQLAVLTCFFPVLLPCFVFGLVLLIMMLIQSHYVQVLEFEDQDSTIK